MGVPHAEQLARKQADVEALLAPFNIATWHPAFAGPEAAYRNKAKMVVGGTVDAPTIGILDADGFGVDLQACGICSDAHRAAFPVLAAFITRAGLAPYDVPSRRGELKHLLLTESPGGELMLRFVLRSTEPVARIRKHLPWLQAALPALRVVSVNLLPGHVAAVEGTDELVLTEADSLPMRLNDVTLHLRPQSFFQTNTPVAAELYATAQSWAAALRPTSAWDLYCGVGGFALHLAGMLDAGGSAQQEPAGAARRGASVVGIETSAEAIASARLSASEAGLRDVSFAVGDATEFAIRSDATPELVVVNPPRRGIGRTLAAWLNDSTVSHVLYSSCNPTSLAADLAAMPALRVTDARLFDMFPQTTHAEVLVALTRA